MHLSDSDLQPFHFSQPDARCLDGSAAGGFARLNAADPVVLLYLEGGGFCDDETSCAGRAWGDGDGDGGSYGLGRGGSDRWGGRPGRLPDLMSTNCSHNPQFCTATLVFLRYCSADRWLGRRRSAIRLGSDKRPYHFAGALIVDAALEMLLSNRLIRNGTRFLLAGQSAGGVGAMAAMDSGLVGRRLAGLTQIDLRVLLAWSVDVDGPEPSFPLCPGTDQGPECAAAALGGIRWGRSGWARDQRWSSAQEVLWDTGPAARGALPALERGVRIAGLECSPTLSLPAKHVLRVPCVLWRRPTSADPHSCPRSCCRTSGRP
jgi:hypothetical protein